MKHIGIGRVVRRVLRENKGLVAALLVTICAAVALVLLPAQILRLIIDRGLLGGDAAALPYLAVLYLLAVTLTGAVQLARAGTLAVLGQKLLCGLRGEMMRKLGRLRTSFFTGHEGGDVVARLTSDVDAAGTLFSDGVVGIVIDLCKIIGIVVSIWIFGAGLGLISLALLPVIFGITRAFQKRMLRAQLENRGQISRLTGLLGETLASRRMVKTCAKEGYVSAQYNACLRDNFRTVDRVNHYDGLYPCVVQLVRAVTIAGAVLLCVGGQGALGVTVGTLAAAMELLSNLFLPVEALGMELDRLQKAIAGLRRVAAFFAQEEQPAPDENLTADVLLRHGAEVCLQDVTFAYAGEPVLRGVTLRIPAGQRVVFVGRTGAGKTTLFRLLLGLLEPDGGTVSVCGAAAVRIPPDARRQVMGYVEQECHLIGGTLLTQVTLRDPRVTREMALRALTFVGLDTAAARLPRGVDTPLTGGGLSQGERQLLAIARAIVLNPPLLLLDEITAGLDAVTERRIHEVLRRAGEGRTILSISHRLSGMQAEDLVVQLSGGRIAQMCTAAEYAAQDDAARQARGAEAGWHGGERTDFPTSCAGKESPSCKTEETTCRECQKQTP